MTDSQRLFKASDMTQTGQIPTMFDFTVLVLPGAFSSGVGAILDMLSTAADLANAAGCAR
ncbi:hypothetical protein [Pseudomonas gingeri]|nr:hypothetical protein [Pseudomonas gingeri]NWA04500.1 hypothetical protein [Pseudomonas gingeri]NWA17309.1 hypothetical protein [Pseudomonas gingeri]NWA56331.1 hypothetical protein [Pseudomonas gingeri]NWA98107.1 hypothetical protein [Pseudomonas gingeri]NWB02525.1 hypothetical protein [Pseudomonas gingeri]